VQSQLINKIRLENFCITALGTIFITGSINRLNRTLAPSKGSMILHRVAKLIYEVEICIFF